MKAPILILSLLIPCTMAVAANSANDTDFATKAADGGMAEVAVGKLAASKASDASVKSFGEKMVTDHTKANDALKSIASKDNIPLPAEPSAKHKAAADKLAKLDGKNFDNAYTKMMVQDHEEDVALFKKEAASGSNPDLKAYAQKTLPTLQEHLDMIKKITAGSK